jgi:hypothetical protein
VEDVGQLLGHSFASLRTVDAASLL